MMIECKNNHVMIPELEKPNYQAAEASRLVGLRSDRVRRWLKGYDYQYDAETRHQKPVISRNEYQETRYASFLDIIDLLFVKRFIDNGISLQKVRKALDEARSVLGTDHFARECFFTDGHEIYLQMKEHGDAILELLSGVQWVIPDIIKELSTQIDFDKNNGLARRWFPQGYNGLVVIDPTVSFGRPSIVHRGITTLNIYDLYLAENRDTRITCSWMNINTSELNAVILFEEQLAA